MLIFFMNACLPVLHLQCCYFSRRYKNIKLFWLYIFRHFAFCSCSLRYVKKKIVWNYVKESTNKLHEWNSMRHKELMGFCFPVLGYWRKWDIFKIHWECIFDVLVKYDRSGTKTFSNMETDKDWMKKINTNYFKFMLWKCTRDSYLVIWYLGCFVNC